MDKPQQHASYNVKIDGRRHTIEARRREFVVYDSSYENLHRGIMEMARAIEYDFINNVEGGDEPEESFNTRRRKHHRRHKKHHHRPDRPSGEPSNPPSETSEPMPAPNTWKDGDPLP